MLSAMATQHTAMYGLLRSPVTIQQHKLVNIHNSLIISEDNTMQDETRKRWQLVMHCHLTRPVMPVILGFSHDDAVI